MASLVHQPGMQLCIIMPEKERHLTFSLFLHFPILCRVATFASVFVVPFSVILTIVTFCMSWKTVTTITLLKKLS